jgi:hypothetical protein
MTKHLQQCKSDPNIDYFSLYPYILLYADDIVLTAETYEEMQLLLDITSQWCQELTCKLV